MPQAQPYINLCRRGNRRKAVPSRKPRGFSPAGERIQGTSLPTPILAGLFATLPFPNKQGQKDRVLPISFRGNRTGGRAQKALAPGPEAKAVLLLNRVKGGVIFQVASSEAGKITPAVRSPNGFANARLDAGVAFLKPLLSQKA